MVAAEVEPAVRVAEEADIAAVYRFGARPHPDALREWPAVWRARDLSGPQERPAS
jgi:hypothetical protein